MTHAASCSTDIAAEACRAAAKAAATAAAPHSASRPEPAVAAMNGAWDTPTARVARWERRPWRLDHLAGIIVYVSGCVTMIAAGVFLLLMGPQG